MQGGEYTARGIRKSRPLWRSREAFPVLRFARHGSYESVVDNITVPRASYLHLSNRSRNVYGVLCKTRQPSKDPGGWLTHAMCNHCQGGYPSLTNHKARNLLCMRTFNETAGNYEEQRPRHMRNTYASCECASDSSLFRAGER